MATTDKRSSFTYGADGLRHKSDVDDEASAVTQSITHYGYDGTNVVREWTENNATHALTISATYLIGLNGPMYRSPATAADVRWYVYDGLGSVVGEVDVNGVLMAEKKHDVYGNNRGVTGTSTSRHGFVGGLGHYSDEETGLIYMRARYYDPSTGRFISQDKAKAGTNWFAYCNNDPVNKSDPTGNEDASLNVQAFMCLVLALAVWCALQPDLINAAFLSIALRSYADELDRKAKQEFIAGNMSWRTEQEFERDIRAMQVSPGPANLAGMGIAETGAAFAADKARGHWAQSIECIVVGSFCRQVADALIGM